MNIRLPDVQNCSIIFCQYFRHRSRQPRTIFTGNRIRMSSVFDSCIKSSFNPAKIGKKAGFYAKEHKKIHLKSKKSACLFGS